jgi:hypothetical protein
VIKRERRRQTGADRKHAYGLSLEQYNELVQKQGGVCAICGKPPTKRALHVDHCHQTSKIRGLLCRGCNLALGNMEEDISRLYKAIAYLERHNE